MATVHNKLSFRLPKTLRGWGKPLQGVRPERVSLTLSGLPRQFVMHPMANCDRSISNICIFSPHGAEYA